MDRNVYQSELDRVRFTEAGKSALTDALMTGRAESEQRRGRGPWMKRGAIAALAAVLPAGWTRRSRPWWTPSAAICRGRSPPMEL